jgi:hypothetical protein
MKEFEFASAGMSVVYVGENFCLSDALLAELEDRYVGRVSDRVLRNMLVVAQNGEAIRYRAEEFGREPTFGTITLWQSSEGLKQAWRQAVKSMCLYRRRLVKATGLCMVWVVEFGRRGGRMHGHFAADGRMDLEVMERAKEHTTVGRCNIKALGAAGYLWKELGKQVGRRGLGIRLMGTLGEFKGRCGVRDFVLDSPMAECRRLAIRTRVTGEPLRLVWERARELYGAWSAGKLDLGPKYDRWRGRISGGGGDAWEDESGDTDFDVGELEGSGALGVVPQQAEPVAPPKAAEGGAS